MGKPFHVVQIRMPKSTIKKTEPSTVIDLSEFLKSNPSDKRKIGLLEQISLSLLEETTCGNIKETYAVVRDLRRIFCFILTDGTHAEYSANLTVEDLVQYSDPNVALDIIAQIGSPGKVTLQEILQHPFFWNDYLKIQFLCKVTDFINGQIGFSESSQNDITEKYSLGYVADVVSECGWIEQLKLRENEIEKVSKKGIEESHFAVNVNMIYNIAKMSEKNDTEDINSVFELVKFLQSIAVHPYHYPSHIWNIFDGFPDGFWKFFSSRFPNLFMHVYTHMRTCILTSHTGGEFLNSKSPMIHIVAVTFEIKHGSDLPGTSRDSIEGNKGQKEKITTQETFEVITLGTTDLGSNIKRKTNVDDDEDLVKAAKLPKAEGSTHFQGFDMSKTSFFDEDDEEIKGQKSVQKKPFALRFPKPFRPTFSSEPYMPGVSFLVKEKRKVKTSPHEIRQVIDAEVESMRETKIFALEHHQLDEDSVKYFCSKLDSGFELSELKFKDCGVDSLFLSTLFDNILEGKVKILNLSENKYLDFSMISELLTKLQCCSLDVTNMEFLGTDLGKLEVKKLILNYGTFPKSISLTLAELLKKGMEELSLVDGNISCEQIQEIYKTLSETEMLSLKVLDLSHIYLEEKEGLEAISMIINRAKGDFVKLRLFNCEIDADSLRAFTEMIDKKINEFVIGCNAKVVEEDMQAVIDVARKVEAEKLDLSSLSLKEHHIQQLKDSQLSKSGKISDLNLSDNSEIEGHCVGELVKAWGIKRLNISLCQFIEKDYKAMVAALGDYKLESIRCNDLSRSVRCEKYTNILKKVADRIFIKM